MNALQAMAELADRIVVLNAEANKLTEDWGDAQKRIAELEAENERLKPGPGHHCYWTDYGERQKRRAEQAEAELVKIKADAGLTTVWSDLRKTEAELAALKGRRCDDCEHFTYLTCPVWPSVHRANTYAPPTPGFCCSSWAEREKA